jgi:hypothetical protein
MNQPFNSERPFQPFEVLRRKPIPSSQMGVLIKLHKKEDIGEPDIKVEKITINDRRKHSSVERKLILDKLRQNKAFGVNIEQKVEKTKPSPEELLSIPIPIGEPSGTFSKIDEIIIEEEKAKEDELDKLLDEAIQVETNEEVLDDELAELNDILNQDKALVEKEIVVIPVEEEIIMEAPIAEKPKAKRGRKAKVVVEEPLINVDLKTAKIREQLVSDMLPKPTEKVIIKAPAYYMNNRKLYVQKLNELFQPYRKEIMADDTGISCEVRQDNKEFELLTHQKIVRDYLNLYTPYRGLLLYHGLGSGKTASSIAIAEGMKSDKRIFILTPASLKMNFFSELKNNGDHLYRKNQYWEFVSIDGKPEYISILSKALSIPVESIRNRGGAWLVNIQKEANFADKNADEQKEIDDQLNEMIRSKYVDINYNGINKKGFQKLVNDLGANPFDNSVVIIDEAHNFVSRIVNKIKKKTSLSYTMYELLMNATNARVVLLTGTPIINYPNEIGILFNILRGYIKTWSMTVNVKTNEKVTTDTILDLFDKARFKTYDYVEYSGNKLTITRNPFGFVNTKKRGALKGTQRKPKQSGGGEQSGGFMETIFGGKKTKSNKPKGNKTTAKKYDTIVDKITFTRVEDEIDAEKAYRVGYNGENEPHMGGGAQLGGGPVADSYNGVHLDETGNLSDTEFQNTIINILKQNGLEVPTGSIEVKKYKALPDEPEPFLNLFVNGNGDVENIDVFKRRILGLTSYFRSAQEQLLPRFEKTADGDIFHIIKSELTPYQFGVYEKIRKVEAEQEKKNKKNEKKAQNKVDDDLYKISSTYRIFSRAACNFVFPPGIERPMPDKKNKEEIDENDLNAVPLTERIANDEVEEEEQANIDTEVVSYQKRITNALDELAYKPEREREQEYLIKEQLGQYSPKFVKLLENVQSEQNQGSHLIYSQFRTIEGIGILKLIFEANGYAEFKIQKKSDGIWDIIENPQAIDKPKFVLYTGTETAEEKEIIRNIYNSNWKFVPASIVTKLQEQHPNNFMGEVIKVFMITSSGAEGINLKNTRYVHIVEPYWHMVRIEQVIGRARRICSHQDLPDELRTVKVFLYISTLSEEQKTSEENVELRIRDVSKLDRETPVTTDETLFETASIKDKVNRQILKAVKESAMDCSLYSAKNKDEPLVCYGYGKVESNQFGSYPALEQDRSEKTDLNVRSQQINMIKITYKGKDYALNERTNELFDYESYLRAKDTGSDILLVGHLIRDAKGMKIELLEEKK